MAAMINIEGTCLLMLTNGGCTACLPASSLRRLVQQNVSAQLLGRVMKERRKSEKNLNGGSVCMLLWVVGAINTDAEI